GLIAEGISCPSLSIVRTLEFDFIARMGHDCEQPVTVGNTEWLQRTYRSIRQPDPVRHSGEEQRCSRIEDPAETQPRDSPTEMNETRIGTRRRCFRFACHLSPTLRQTQA